MIKRAREDALSLHSLAQGIVTRTESCRPVNGRFDPAAEPVRTIRWDCRQDHPEGFAFLQDRFPSGCENGDLFLQGLDAILGKKSSA
jgi:hypothetical protein